MNKTAFSDSLHESIGEKIKQIQEIYLADQIPWVVGYSGGKDSTAALQLAWLALFQLPKEKRHKEVHVISTDTLVENPIVATWVNNSLKEIEVAAKKQDLPIYPHPLTPTLEDSFWVNLLGKGYPAPRQKFRWCTLRLKISPSNRFIREMVSKNGEAIVVLGTRSAESSARSHVISEHKKLREKTGFYLSPNSALENCFIYSPIEDWSNDDVWQFLMSYKNPWDYSNQELMSMYAGATSGGECPLVVETGTESCGKSRFGCWVCTLVDEDKSMTAMIANDQEKEWLYPLLEFRNQLDFRTEEDRKRDRARRDFRRMDGHVYAYGDNLVPGPYTTEARAELLEMLLEVQMAVQEAAPPEFSDITIITGDEIREIRRIWVQEKRESEDILPAIYQKVTGKALDDEAQYRASLPPSAFDVLKDLCSNRIEYEMIRGLLSVEQEFRHKARRAGISDAIEKEVRRSFFEDAEDARQYAIRKQEARNLIKESRENEYDSTQVEDYMKELQS